MLPWCEATSSGEMSELLSRAAACLAHVMRSLWVGMLVSPNAPTTIGRTPPEWKVFLMACEKGRRGFPGANFSSSTVARRM